MRKVWQISAITLVLLAILVSLLKYSLPYANDHRLELEQFLAEQFNVDISIGSLSANWQGNGPALVINDISFADNENAPISVTIKQTRLHVNLWQSLLSRQLSSNYFVLEGFDAQVDARQLFANDTQDGGSQQQALIENLFLGNSGHFAIEDSRLRIISVDDREHRILLENLVWENRVEGHFAQGQVSLPGIEKNTLEARLKLSGETLPTVYGDLYLQAQGLDISGWLQEYMRDELSQLQSDLNLESWLHIAGGRLTDIQVAMQPSQLSWRNNDQPEYLELQQGMVRMHPQAKGWRVRTSGLQLSDEQYQWSPIIFDALFSNEQRIWVQDLDISVVSTFARLAKSDMLHNIVSIEPQGFINEGYFHWQSGEQWRVWFEAEHLGWSGFHGIPGAQELSAKANITSQKGVLQISGVDNHLLTGDTFSTPLAYQNFIADIDFYNRGDYWSIESENVQLTNQDLDLVSEFALHLDAQPKFDLYAEITGGSAKSAGDYFPKPYMHDNLINYLNGAIKQGDMRFAQVLLQGPISEFPFAQQQGRFLVQAQVDDVEFAFAPDWPALQEAGVTLSFDNQRMDIYSRKGKLLNLELGNKVHVYLQDLQNADVLYVDINEQVDATVLQPFFAGTPLAQPLATVFDVIQAKGQLDGQIQLQIGLKDTEVVAKGYVTFSGTPVYIAQPGIDITELTGKLSFENDRIELTGARALWLGMPVSVDVLGQQQDGVYNTAIDVALELDSEVLTKHLGGLLEAQLTGKTALDANIALKFSEQGFNYEATVQGDLVGINSTLPEPYNKHAEDTRTLKAIVQGDDISNLIMAELESGLFFNGIFDNQSKRMSNAHLIVGQKNLGLNQRDFDVTVQLQNADIIAWQPVIDDIIALASQPSTQAPILPPLNKVSGSVQQANVGPVPFTDVEFTLTPVPGAMDLKLNAKELRARVDIPVGESAVGREILVKADYLRAVVANDEANIETDIETDIETKEPQNNKTVTVKEQQAEDLSWLARLPSVRFDCQDCRLNEYQLDKVLIRFAGDNTQLNISELLVDKDEHVLRANGIWRDGATLLSGQFNSKDIGQLFDEFDLTSTVQDSKAKMDFDLTWQGAPYDFNVASLGGEVKWELGEGHLRDISDGGARVFSLLSLDSLVRKLKLDFRDVFAKGFFYNSMEGSIQLEQGIAYTQDTKMDGVPADLTIKGYADLNTQTINYDLAVAPQVTSSLPVIVAWMVNPVTGLAALALDKVIHSARVISEINFKVTGSMSDPQVIELDRKSREVTLPQAAQSQPSSEPAPSQPQQQQEQPQS
ncbi:YhdP family protein [Pseudoalteromonas sp. SSDWG2]|uniref:YhdP family protein n=1 Tax=Pseudoalteromonas sp. SSDWG2 TaxID=3139391 RepID=UPI003BAA70BB